VIDAKAMGAWGEVERHLRPFVARRTDDPAEVDDVLQDVYLRIQTGLDRIRDSERFGPWVYRVARSALADHARARARHHPRGQATAVVEELAEEPAGGEESQAERELATYLTAFVAALPSPYREAVLLTELQELTQREAAERLGISLAAVKARVRRGRQRIRDMLRACCEIALDARGHVLAYDRRIGGKVPPDCCALANRCKC
jgi:RNA polymerase sigma-70 factor (ECF subfamily)